MFSFEENGRAMKILLKHVHHVPSSSLIQLVRAELESMKGLMQIDEARVLLEHRHQASPAFKVAFHLVTPGPDVQAEAEDHTLRAALLKAFDHIRNRIVYRQHKRRRAKLEAAGSVRSRKR